ncbi:hypothetical protein [Streptomyces sp. NPDC059712]|uniref:hypothetical protein n=1 Tax=Streptomyces sp. NPDC059712 TaxID=3346919 RepID=UPI003687E2EB
MNAPLKVFALLEAQGVPASEADDLVAALEAGAVAGALCQVVELGGMAPTSRGPLFSDGWDDGVTAVSEALVGIADREWSRRGGRSAGAAELAVHIADVRQRERADLVRLERFVRENVLPRTHPHTTARRRCWRRWVRPAVCARPGRGTWTGTSWSARSMPGTTTRTTSRRSRTESQGGWHKADASIWNDLGAACIPHAAL